jgi:hypothetical protein
MRRRIAVVTALVCAASVVAPMASATQVETDAAPEVVVDGSGVLEGRGRGKVVLRGEGFVRLAMKGRLVIVDHAGDAVITFPEIDTTQPETDSTRIVIEHFAGIVIVEGSDFTVKARGGIRRLRAEGSGVAFLKGRGWWRVEGVGHGHWSPWGTRISYTAT